MTINISSENMYLGFIVLFILLQISQWYYIFSLKKQLHGVWTQIAAMALMLYAKEASKNEQLRSEEKE